MTVQTTDTDALLASLGLERTGEACAPGDRTAKFSLGEIPGGRRVVFSEDFDWALKRTAELSRFGPLIGCRFEDKVEMLSECWAMREGIELWRVRHAPDGEEGPLEVTGDPPVELEALKARAERLMREDEDGGAFYELPLDLCEAVSGFRPDVVLDPDWSFEALRRSRGQGGLFSRIAAMFGGGRG